MSGAGLARDHDTPPLDGRSGGGRIAALVTRLRRVPSVMAFAMRNFSADRGAQAAAAIAYYSLVSVMPLLVFLVGVAGLLFQRSEIQRVAVDTAVGYLPAQAGQLQPLLESALAGVAGRQGAALSAVGLVGAMWTASAMFGQIRLSLNVAFNVPHRRPLAQQKLVDLGMVLVAGLLLAGAAGTTTLLQVIGHLDLVQALPSALWTTVSFVAPLVLVLAAFLFLYWLVPAHRLRPTQVAPAAVAAAVAFEALAFGFAFYVSHFGHYGVIYGSLGVLVALLFWVYLASLVLIFGAEVAAVTSRRRAGPTSTRLFTSPDRRPLRQKVFRLLRSLVAGPGPSSVD